MAAKKKVHIEEKVSLDLRFPKFVGYIDYLLQTPALIRVKSTFEEALTLTVSWACEGGLLLPFERSVEVPFESTVRIEQSGIFSPLFLAENDEVKTVTVSVSARHDGKEVAAASAPITVLPFDVWEGLSGNAERVASFVRPRLSDCAVVLADAGRRLKKWKADAEFYGYAGTDKNAVRQIAAAVYASVKAYGISQEPCDLTGPVAAAREGSVLKTRTATVFELAVLAASCLEAAGLHPVLALGKGHVGVGVWLYDTCFLDPVTDDGDIISKYVSDGINNLSFFDAADLFVESNALFTPSEHHFRAKLKENYFECFVDVKRCRMGGILPCSMRGKGLKGYEVFEGEEEDGSPKPLPVFKGLKLDGKQPKNKQWERRLLDLTGKNALLVFTGKNALHISSADCDFLYSRLMEEGSMKLKAGGEEAKFGAERTPQKKALITLEQQKGVLRMLEQQKTAAETAIKLIRRNREAGEEAGAKILYMALGFLKYVSREDGMPKYAPLVLVPVGISRAKGNEDFSLTAGEEGFFVNATLLEFLKQEFNIDIRGLGGDVSALKISEILAMVRAETATMKGWDVVEDVYIAAFSFQRFLLWNDIRAHIDDLKKNENVAALLAGKSERRKMSSTAEEDDADPEEVLLPLPADSSQFSAIALAGTGASFVLYGPPGTGKSQTITNIIAGALMQGKRVIFVAEKKAALDVVKKRLDAIGIGDFCLELHSNKTDKSDVLRRLEETLSLAGKGKDASFGERTKELIALREELKEPMEALHRKRRLGISVYGAVLGYLENRSAPDILDIETAFYDTLTEQKLSECKTMILTAAAAAKECGGVCNSPFENVNLTEFSQEVRDRILCASEVVLTEIKHLRSYLALFLEFYRQRVSTLTKKKLAALSEIAKILVSGDCKKYFAGQDEGAFYLFYNANRRLDTCLAYYFKHFRSLVDTDDAAEIAKLLESGGDWRCSKAAKAAFKRLSKVALHELDEEDAPKYLQTLVDIDGATRRICGNTKLAENFTDRAGRIVFKRRGEFLELLYRLHTLAGEAFLDFNADAFNGMCIRAANGYTMPVLEGFLKALDAYFAAEDSFMKITRGSREKVKGEDALDYFYVKASALIDNVDMLPNWCMYRATAKKLAALGLTFISDSLESGRLKVENVLAGFEKNVYKNFLEITIPQDAALSRMTVGTLEDTVEKFRLAWEEYGKITRAVLRDTLISRLPSEDEEGSLALELASFTRFARSNLRGSGIRTMLAEIPTLASVLCPCLLMSPITVAQYLQPVADQYDLVIFDEASQMSTAEAVGAIARAKAAVVVGDPKQLPPTTFFHSTYTDEDDLENEDLESILDDCLALGMPERHLVWHYRSKHESLIAFSNGMYYDNRLCTFPSPDALESKVRLIRVDGTYDRGFTKRNRAETEALVAEVIRRLSDPVLSRSSMGIVTFSSAQQEDIEKLLTKEIVRLKLDGVAYEREEPVFVKNLENVQGDERDVILFSVCYGPDRLGRVSLNFGPLNQAGGWRRLNVAVSRAREEMLVFSTMTSAMIDLNKTSSKGVAGLKAFLEFAEKGRTTLAVRSDTVRRGAGIGKYIAAELSAYGYDCRYDVGASDFKVDVAVVDPRNKHRFVLGILCDGNNGFSVKDRNILQVQTLKRGNWNILRLNTVNYYNNPKRELKRIKDVLDRLTGGEKRGDAWLTKYKRPYKPVKTTASETSVFVTGGEHDAAIVARLKEIVASEEPISRAFLRKRCLQSFGIERSGSKVEARLDSLIDSCGFNRDRAMGVDYFYRTPRAIQLGRFRVEGDAPAVRKNEEDFTVYEVVSLVKGALEDRVALYMDEVAAVVSGVFREIRPTERSLVFLRDCISYGEEKGVFVRSVSDRITLA